MTETNMIKKRATSFIVLSFLLASFVGAYGVASPYWEGNPLKIAPGDTKTASITIQNVGEQDIVVQASLEEGSQIASIREGEYTVPAGTIDTEILVTVSIPENASLNELHKVTLSSREIVSGNTGGVALGTAFETTFDVLVSDISKTQREGGVNSLILIIVLIVLISSILTIILRKKNKRKK